MSEKLRFVAETGLSAAPLEPSSAAMQGRGALVRVNDLVDERQHQRHVESGHDIHYDHPEAFVEAMDRAAGNN